MISRLRGIILEKQLSSILIEVGGIGYEVHIPKNFFYKLPNIGQEVIIFTQFIVRKDTLLLFGFDNKQELILFCEIIKINGIGPNLALIIISNMSISEFINTIKNEDFNELIKLPGIGKKIAKRLIIEMKNRLKNLYENLSNSKIDQRIFLSEDLSNKNIEKEAISALISLGFKTKEASFMVSKVIKQNSSSSEDLIRKALRTTLCK